MKSREQINKEIEMLQCIVANYKEQIFSLHEQALLLSDDKQQFKETLEDVVIKKRPKVTEKKLIGRIFWKESFTDESTGNLVYVDRARIVRVNGTWV